MGKKHVEGVKWRVIKVPRSTQVPLFYRRISQTNYLSCFFGIGDLRDRAGQGIANIWNQPAREQFCTACAATEPTTRLSSGNQPLQTSLSRFFQGLGAIDISREPLQTGDQWWPAAGQHGDLFVSANGSCGGILPRPTHLPPDHEGLGGTELLTPLLLNLSPK